jgi:hypothetical protein
MSCAHNTMTLLNTKRLHALLSREEGGESNELG